MRRRLHFWRQKAPYYFHSPVNSAIKMLKWKVFAYCLAGVCAFGKALIAGVGKLGAFQGQEKACHEKLKQNR